MVGELTRTAGLPEWVPPFALTLLLIGFPVVLATAVVQEGGPVASREPPRPPLGSDTPEAAEPDSPAAPAAPAGPSFLERHLTWKRSLLGGAAAFGLLVLLVVAYFASWATGIGPVGSLVAQGAIEEGERVVLADFQASAGDPGLGAVVTDALRIDLYESPALRVLEPVEVQSVLRRMQVDERSPLTAELAREVALRDGVKAVLEGEAAQAGSGYVLSATLRSAETGLALAAFRETARSVDEVVPAIDRLSRRIRERAGESLRSIHAGQRLERVTTSSLDALRVFSEANRAFEHADFRRAIALLEEALEIDPGFAMAWRRLAVVLNNTNLDPVRQAEAATRAHELRDRLTEKERHLAAAFYHSQVRQDQAATAEAYRRVLALDPDDPPALNNLANIHTSMGDLEGAEELYARAAAGPGASSVAFGNLVQVRIAMGRIDDAARAVEAFAETFPDNREISRFRFWVLLHQGDEAGARAEMEPLLQAADADPAIRIGAHDRLASLAAWRGRMAEAREHLAAAERIAAESGAALWWFRRMWTAALEAFIGDPVAAADLVLRELEDDGRASGLDPSFWPFLPPMIVAWAGRADEAESLIRQWEAAVPTEARGQSTVTELNAVSAIIAIQRGQPDEAIRILEGLRASRSCATCWSEVMGWALRDAGRPAEALAEWEHAAKMRDNNLPAALLTHFWVLPQRASLFEEVGDASGALEDYRRLVELWSDGDPEVQPVVRHARERIAALAGGR